MSEPVAEFDFRKPCTLPAEVESRMRQWQEAICRIVNEQLEEMSPCSLTLSEGEITTNHAIAITYEDPVVCFDNNINSIPDSSLLLIKRSLGVGIFRSLIGTAVENLETDRELTRIETELLRAFFETLITACNEAQLEKPTCELGECDVKPDFVTKFDADADVAIVQFRLEGPFGGETIDWIWRQDIINASVRDDGSSSSATNSEELLEIARQIPFQVTVMLGSATLRVSDLKALKEGDVVVFDQRVSDELSATIGGKPFFYGWAGKVGKRQGLQISRAG